MLTMDSNASESKATEFETKYAISFMNRMTTPPNIATRAACLFRITIARICLLLGLFISNPKKHLNSGRILLSKNFFTEYLKN
jgi:hypothetical protein